MSPQWEGGLELDSASDCDNANVEVGTAEAQDHATENGRSKGLHQCCKG